MSASTVHRSVTCLGCGCGCDDLTVSLEGGRISEISPPCPLATKWFGDGNVPADVRVGGAAVAIEKAIEAAAALLAGSRRPLVLIAADLSTEAQRTAIAIADLIRAEVDGFTSDTAAAGILTAQRRGRSAATLGEIRNRADTILYWAVDPDERYPRYRERYSAAGSATHVQRRTVLSVSVGADRGPETADLAAEFSVAEEVNALGVISATVRSARLGQLPDRLRPAVALGERLAQGKYVAIVHDAESAGDQRDAQRTESLVALAQVLNEPTRAALSSLRGGGNRTGAEAALTWQTGFPMRVSYREGRPRYQPSSSGQARLRSGEADVALVAGSAVPLDLRLGDVAGVVIGPSASRVAGTRVAIDTGIAGIHERGVGYRMDDVPLPLSPVLSHPRSAADLLGRVLRALREGTSK